MSRLTQEREIKYPNDQEKIPGAVAMIFGYTLSILLLVLFLEVLPISIETRMIIGILIGGVLTIILIIAAKKINDGNTTYGDMEIIERRMIILFCPIIAFFFIMWQILRDPSFFNGVVITCVVLLFVIPSGIIGYLTERRRRRWEQENPPDW